MNAAHIILAVMIVADLLGWTVIGISFLTRPNRHDPLEARLFSRFRGG